MLERDSRPRNMPKTVNNRCQTLRHLFHVLDGKRQPTSADEVDVLPIPPTVKRLVSPEIFKRVAENLKEGDAKTRARFMVIGATGCHPASLNQWIEPSSPSSGSGTQADHPDKHWSTVAFR